MDFSKHFKGMQGVMTHQSEDIDYNDGWEAMPTHAEGCKYAKIYRFDYCKNNNNNK